jgi:hypothetical protein
MKLTRTKFVKETVEVSSDDFEEALEEINSLNILSSVEEIINRGDWYEVEENDAE